MHIDINVVSDFVCPWCFLGRDRLMRAVAQFSEAYPEHPVRIHWLPYFLNPDTPAAGEPYRPFLEKKFGNARAVDALFARVREAAQPDGLELAFERITQRPNTLHAHRLIYRAQSRGARPERIQALVGGVFEAYFQRGQDIGNVETLADIAAACGERREAIVEYLSGNEDGDAVRRMADQVSRQGVEGVPFFIFNRSLAVSGAQSLAALGAALRQVAGVRVS
ncbi:MAG: DsbA family oxidoreductase [Pseudazoarcus pumilus]|nr:DsbA family oxidoreductase [Pseudazoarcus pumilus]